MHFFITILLFLLLFYLQYSMYSNKGTDAFCTSMDVAAKMESKEFTSLLYNLHWGFLLILFLFSFVIYFDLLFYVGLQKPESLYEDRFSFKDKQFLVNYPRNFETLQHLKEVESIGKIRLEMSLLLSFWFMGLLLVLWWTLYLVFKIL